MRFIVER